MEETKALVSSRAERIKPTIVEIMWLFIIGCVVGTLWEELLTVIVDHKFESRAGLVYGPFNPVYGVGAVLMTLVLLPVSGKKAGVILLVGAAAGGGLEYFSSLAQELIFGTVSWNYNGMPLNIGGRTTVPYMLFWGVAGLMWMRLLPGVLSLIDRIPHLRVVTAALAIFMALNMAVSATASLRMDERREGEPPSNAVERLMDVRFPDERMQRIYPNAVVTHPAA